MNEVQTIFNNYTQVFEQKDKEIKELQLNLQKQTERNISIEQCVS